MTRDEFSERYYGNVSGLIDLAWEHSIYSLTDNFYNDDSIADMICNSISGSTYEDWHGVICSYVDIEESPYDLYFMNDYGELSPITDNDDDWLYNEVYEDLDNAGFFEDDDENEDYDDNQGEEIHEEDDKEFIRSDEYEEELLNMRSAIRPIETLFAV